MSFTYHIIDHDHVHNHADSPYKCRRCAHSISKIESAIFSDAPAPAEPVAGPAISSRVHLQQAPLSSHLAKTRVLFWLF